MAKRRERIAIVHIPCRRCGKPLTATNRSIYGLDALKAKYGGICRECLTKDEQQEMLGQMGEGILHSIGGKA